MKHLKYASFLASFLVIAGLSLSPTGSFAQTFHWAKNIGNSNDVTAGTGATDSDGNTVYSGYYENTIDLDPGAANDDHPSNGKFDAFLTKIDTAGNYLWGFHLGDNDDDFGGAVAIDFNDDIIFVGNYNDSIDLDPGVGTQLKVSAGATDIFIAKYDANGNFQWGGSIGGTSAEDVKDVVTDAAGNVYVTGSYGGTADMDPGAGTSNLVTSGQIDAFILKIDASGNFQWANKMGGTGADVGFGLRADAAGNIYGCGSFSTTVDFDPSGGTANITSAGITDAFIVKYDSSGNHLASGGMGGSSIEQANAIAFDDTGNVFVVGYFQSSGGDFDPGNGTASMTSSGLSDIFVVKLDANLAYKWSFKIGDGGGDLANDIAIDGLNNIYLTGSFTGSVDFDPSFNFSFVTSGGITDAFIAKYTSAGAYTFCYPLGGNSTEVGNSLEIDVFGGIVTTGVFFSTTDFDIGTGTQNVNPGSGSDVFVHRISQCIQPTAPTISVAADTTCIGDSVVLTLSGGALNSATTWQWYESSCGGTTAAQGTSVSLSPTITTTYYVRAEGGCATPSACDDVIVTVGDVFAVTDSQDVCQGANFTFPDGSTAMDLQSDTTQQSVLMTVLGCDSTVTTVVTVDAVDAGVNLAAGTLTATATNATYQWIDCDNGNTAIAGETNQSYTPDSAGNYAVVVTEGNCTDTSICTMVTPINIDPFAMGTITSFPNPVERVLKVQGLADLQGGSIQIVNHFGVVIQAQEISNDVMELDCSDFAAGYYYILLKSGDKQYSRKFTKL